MINCHAPQSPPAPMASLPERPPAVMAGEAPQFAAPTTPAPAAADPVLCQHCGRTAGNGISCQGICVADSGY